MRIAVIDIGSNAIRAAVYDNNELGAAEIFNEKFKSDITSLLELENMDIRHGTYNIFNYFIHIFDQLNVAEISCVATEVLRNHKQSQKVIDEIYKRFSIKVQILSGDEEAKITAEGLISSIPDAKGVVADLGGGSLELAEVFEKKVHQVTSIPIGTKVLNRLVINDISYVLQNLEQSYKIKNYDNLYLIGGALRLLGRCFMDYNNNIIKNLHNLVIDPHEFLEFLDKLETLQKFQQFFKQYKINKHAITVVRGLIAYFNPINLIVSTFGLKEGVRFNLLSPEEQKKDIAFERCIQFAKSRINNLSIDDYKELFSSINLELSEEISKLLVLSLILCHYPIHIDRSYKAEWMINFILTTDIPFNQKQRASLIISVAHALSNKTHLVPKSIRRTLNKKEYIYAQIMGSFIKVAIMVDGPVLTKPSFTIIYNDKFLEIVTDITIPRNIFDKICIELKNIALSCRNIQNY